jgi:hypothetical protein
MAFQFPLNPIIGQTFTPISGTTYRWSGTAWYLVTTQLLTVTEADLLYIALTQKAAVNGVATLDAGGKVPVAQLPLSIVNSLCQARISVNVEPIPSAGGTSGSLFLHPFKGNSIALWDGSAWTPRAFASQSLSLSTPSGNCYDVFAAWNGSAVVMEILAWANVAARATALELFQGVYVKLGDGTRRYLGTIYCRNANTCEDSEQGRHVWNYYNRAPRSMKYLPTEDSHVWNGGTWRQWGALTPALLDFTIGIVEDELTAQAILVVNSNQAGGTITAGCAIGMDGIVPVSAHGTANLSTLGSSEARVAFFQGYTPIGRHSLIWLEYSAVTGVTTFFGDANNPAVFQCGIVGSLMG